MKKQTWEERFDIRDGESLECAFIRNYCNDIDCTVDPYDPECRYH